VRPASTPLPDPHAQDPRIAVVIVNYNTRDHLVGCLASIGLAAAQVVVVDNGSTDGSQEAVREDFPYVDLLEDGVNRGYGGAANRGIREVHTPYVLVLNSDTTLRPQALGALADYLDANPRAACAGPRLRNPDGSLQMSVQRFPTPATRFWETRVRALNHETARAVDWVKGAALALRRSALAEVSGFDDRYFMYFEEVDLCWRLRCYGWETHFVPAAEVVHLGAASTSQVRSAMSVAFVRAREQFFYDHYGAPRAAAYVVLERMRIAGLLAADVGRLIGGPAERRSAVRRALREGWNLMFARYGKHDAGVS